jgi:hypothetical protein
MPDELSVFRKRAKASLGETGLCKDSRTKCYYLAQKTGSTLVSGFSIGSSCGSRPTLAASCTSTGIRGC